VNFIKSLGGIFWSQNEKRFRMVWRLLIFSLLLFGLMMLFSTLSGIINFTNASSMLVFIILLAVLTALLIAGKWIDRREISGFGLQLSRAWWQDFGFGLTLGAFLMGAIFLITWLTGNLQITGYFHKVTLNSPFMWQFLDALFFFICVGIYEELILRGYLLINLAEGLKINWLGKKVALITSLIISSIIFGVLHIVNPNASWISTITISLAGVFLGLGLVLTGRLGLPIGLHITWNFFQGNVFGFPVSGSNFGVSLIRTELIGPEWLTGGAFGPEAGVLGLLAMIFGCWLIMLWVKWKGSLAFKKDLTVYEPKTRHG
jgi:membrane protease YdiL (CAAX protease family)